MPSFQHTKLIERVSQLDTLPADNLQYSTWITAQEHLAALRDNAAEDELIVHATGPNLYTYIHTVIISERDLKSLTPVELLSWEGTPHHPRAGFVSFGETDDLRIEQDSFRFGTKTLQPAPHLAFIRHFEGMQGTNASSVEILQEYTHATEIHFLVDRTI